MKLTLTSSKILLAMDFFRELHKEQKRKDGVRPYFVHLEDVAARVSQVTSNEDVIIAALAHDSVEDVPGFTLDMVAAEFGHDVADTVNYLTDVYVKSAYPELNRRTRKQLERERYKTFSKVAKWVKLSDIASNLADAGESPDAGFMGMFGREKALCLPYLEDDSSSENRFLYAQAKSELAKARERYSF